MQPQGPSPTLFFDTINSYQRTEALRSAIELDVFSAMSPGPRTASELASACGTSERGIRILADYLVILGFLTKADQKYALTPDTAFFLDRKSPAYIGGATGFLLTPQLKECFAHLTEAVRSGGTAVSDEGTVSHDNPIWVDFARAMAPLMELPAKLLTDLIQADPQEGLRVLDVAAGHGLFGIAIAVQYPNAQVTALDWANVLSVAQENAKEAGVAHRHSLLSGSAFDLDWKGPYDLVLLTNFLHHFDLATCKSLAEKAYKALAPGGRTITLDFIPEPDRISPPSAAGFSLVMLASTAKGEAYTFAEYDAVFRKAGFIRNEFHSLPPTTQQAIVSYKA
jgi:2-polyprenyl-3-methyl-5-hydroxy-6-metoxy-1,4-benzoquinol methylase